MMDSLYHPLTAPHYTQHAFKVGPYMVAVFGPRGDAVAYAPIYTGNGARLGVDLGIPFPDAKSALDWVRWRLFGRWVDRVSQIGAWFVNKYRTQHRQNTIAAFARLGGDGRPYADPHRASLNMKKQGLPLEIRNYVLAGA